MQIYFVRHGKTEWNLQKRLQGQTGDSPLLPESYATIKKVRNALSDIDFDMVLSSFSPRALTTARLLTDSFVGTDNRLAEWDFGELEGCLITKAIARYPKEMYNSRYALDRFDGSVFGAETVNQVLERFDNLAKEIIYKTHENSKILWVGHGASGTAGIRHLAGFQKSELRAEGGLENNAISILELQDKDNRIFKILDWNRQL